MKDTSVLVEFHWCGFGIVGGPFGRVLCLGFVSVQYVPFLITQKFREMLAKLR